MITGDKEFNDAVRNNDISRINAMYASIPIQGLVYILLKGSRELIDAVFSIQENNRRGVIASLLKLRNISHQTKYYIIIDLLERYSFQIEEVFMVIVLYNKHPDILKYLLKNYDIMAYTHDITRISLIQNNMYVFNHILGKYGMTPLIKVILSIEDRFDKHKTSKYTLLSKLVYEI